MRSENTRLKVLGGTMHTVNYSVSVIYEIYALKIEQRQEYLPHYTWYVMFQIHKNNY